jgi:hypothetical protein
MALSAIQSPDFSQSAKSAQHDQLRTPPDNDTALERETVSVPVIRPAGREVRACLPACRAGADGSRCGRVARGTTSDVNRAPLCFNLGQLV